MRRRPPQFDGYIDVASRRERAPRARPEQQGVRDVRVPLEDSPQLVEHVSHPAL